MTQLWRLMSVLQERGWRLMSVLQERGWRLMSVLQEGEGDVGRRQGGLHGAFSYWSYHWG
jgi:hypothetical protein